jgi:RNA polymerase sigma factor (sigma-70 family)
MGEAELRDLISGCLLQNRKQQKKLYKAFYGFAMGICLRYAGNRYDAAEIMNHGFLNAFTHLEKFDQTKPFQAWLGRIMINASVDFYRSNLKWANTEDLDNVVDMGHYELPDRRLHYDDLLVIIQQLPNAYRTVFNLFAVEGFTHEEIAEQLGISPGTSKSNLFKAREKLKALIVAQDRFTIGNGNRDIKIISYSAAYIGVSILINEIFK